ncbi:MAG: hypothetical protein ISR77_24545 [Pirellulaceae bacterium]|nr:hypothetical protein [Pirellulaceae bacterium]
MRASALGLTILMLNGVVSTTTAAQSEAYRDAGSAGESSIHRTGDVAAPAQSPPRSIFSRQSTFAIPFAVDRTERSAQEVLLFFSTDYGRTWRLYARQPSAEGRFVFRAGGDGDYWFASRTAAPGTTTPATDSFKPELSVIVDTVKPRVDLQSTVNADGEIRIAWDIFDQYLTPGSFKLEYQSGLTSPWRPIHVQAPNDGARGTTLRGETDWQPDKSDRIVSIRVQASDNAENTSEMTRRLIIPLTLATRTPSRNTMTAASIPSDPFEQYGLTPNETERRQTPPAKEATWPPKETDTWPAKETDTRQDEGNNTWRDEGNDTREDEGTDTWRNEVNDTRQDEGTDKWRGGGNDARPKKEDEDRGPSSRPQPESVAWPNDDKQDDNGYWQNDYPSSQSPVGPPVANRTSSSRSGATDDSSAESTFSHESGERKSADGRVELPAGERPHMTNSKRFNLDYSIDAVGPMGVDKVELWVTRNGGRDWDLWGLDEDRETPFLVSVKEQGVYGFRIVIVGRNGLASQTPRSGDLADLWVGFDNTKPVAELTSAAYGSESYSGHLDIRWTVSDDFLGSKPITLLFNENRYGSWTPIAAGLPNSGQYHWRVDSRVPDKFYLRLEVRDEAGNVTTHDLEEPIKSAGLTPKAHVRGIRPFDR